MIEPIWLERDAIVILHGQSVVQHGGPPEIRDEGLLDSALARPKNLFAYNDGVDLCALAAAYAFGIAKNHPFIDGNKRAAFIAMTLFLDRNGLDLVATDGESIIAVFDLASGAINEDGFAQWLRDRTEPLKY